MDGIVKKQGVLVFSAIGLLTVGTVQSATLRDPTLPPTVAATAPDGATAGGLRLDGFRQRVGGVPEAMINGRLYKTGETVDGLRIIKIGEGAVVLRGAARQETLRMQPVEHTLGVGE